MRTRSFFKLTSLFAMVILTGTLSIPTAAAEDKTEDVAPTEGTSSATHNTTIGFEYQPACPGWDDGSCVDIYNGTNLVGEVTAFHTTMDQLLVSDYACDGVGPWGQVWFGYWQTLTDTDGCAGNGTVYFWPSGEGPSMFRAAFAHFYTSPYIAP